MLRSTPKKRPTRWWLLIAGLAAVGFLASDLDGLAILSVVLGILITVIQAFYRRAVESRDLLAQIAAEAQQKRL